MAFHVIHNKYQALFSQKKKQQQQKKKKKKHKKKPQIEYCVLLFCLAV